MKAVILAAGVGSRLRPLTLSTPKALIPVGGIPLLQRTLTALRSVGLVDVVIVTGYLADVIERFAGELATDFRITFVRNSVFERTYNNYSLWLTKSEVLGHDMCLLDADILFEQSIMRDLLSSSSPDALVIRRVAGLGAEEVKVECDPEGVVLRIGKEVDPQKAAGESLGIEKFSSVTTKSIFASLDRRKDRDEFYEASFQEVIDAGARIRTVDAGLRACIEIDTPDDLRAAEILTGFPGV